MNRNILLVDDDPIIQFIETESLQEFNIPVNISSHLNGRLALDFLQKEYNDTDSFIVLLDINMPVMGGWEFLDELVNLNYDTRANLKIYVVSSSSDESDILKAGTYKNVVKFISKPIETEDYQEIMK